MQLKRFTNWCICVALLLSGMASSCQKDATDSEIARQQAVVKADSAIAKSSPGNYLALSGTLIIRVQDSTYKFDAATDSIAFVNMNVGDDKYFGVTAINKDHTMSFGLSSKGMAATDVTRGIEGSQLILRPDAMHTQQYSLTRFTETGDAGNIKLTDYRRDTVLAKGSFFTFLAKDDKEGSPFYRVEGKFDLKIKK
ncbi:hypothetical protein [Mucilaginibacter glaciei]|uniref:DUF4251 domain-containing protein n=1 Tax=Mucilaginibacter glaciei TaxID=2772109 RepID=A0A926NRB8_9SPHI|nr:hypothetical protein [Mucilaginibacter glaciei]MBD1394591.1 hypothetical protein [Mucilaginibacter glaciei]